VRGLAVTPRTTLWRGVGLRVALSIVAVAALFMAWRALS
jgi:hypothetical protein